MPKKTKLGRCLIEGCPSERTYARGLCSTHYQMIGKMVQEKKRTWEEFINVGMAREAIKGHTCKQALLLKKVMAKKLKK